MDQLLQDVRYAVRTLRKTPLITVLAIVCLALGIGANTTMFSVVHSTLIQPLPFTEPDRLVDIWAVSPDGDDTAAVSYPDYLDWKRETRSFEQLVGFSYRSLTLGGNGDPERVSGGAVSAGLFELLGVPLAAGRDIAPVDDIPGAAPVVVLTDGLWRRRYGADPEIVGKTVLVNDRPHTVIGVLPPRVEFPFRQEAYVALAPLVHQTSRLDRQLELFGRLKPGVTLEQARQELQAVIARLSALYPEDAGWGAHVRPLRDYFAPDEVKLSTTTGLGAVTLVLLIACANVASLLLARATGRRREMSLRAALGAGRARLVRQLLTEAFIFGLLAIPLGILLADAGLTLLMASMPADDIPYLIEFHLNGTALIYTVVISALSSIVFGLAPAWHAARVNLIAALRDGGRTGNAGARTRGRNVLVVAEVATAFVLLIGATLFMRSFLNVQQASPGFDTAPLLTMRVFMPGERYEDTGAKSRRVADIIERIEALPGVQAAAASNLVPLDGGGGESRLVVDGVPTVERREPHVYYTGVTQRFFDALGVPLLRGRGFTRAEAESASAVALVNVSFVRRYLTDGGERPAASTSRRLRGAADLGTLDPTGRRIRLLDVAGSPWLTIVGVVPDIMTDEVGDHVEHPAVFVSYPHLETANTGLIVRAAGDPALLTGAIREAVRASDPGLPIFQASTMEELREKGFWHVALFGWMFAIFGGLALVLGAAGVYGVLSFAVSERTQEFGVRLALGASSGDVLRLTVLQGLKLVGAGVILGIAGAIGVTRVFASLLHEVSPTDLVSFVVVVLVLGTVGFLASYLPARRAARVDPIIALRAD
ncbi:MAG TPA: ABC transporter permease [Vicinamibacterales bacterium]